MSYFTVFALHILTLADGSQFATWCHEHSKWLHRKLAPDQPARSERWLGSSSDQTLSIYPETGGWVEDNCLSMFILLTPR